MGQKSSLALILIVGFLVRIFLSPFGTLELDSNTFVAWSNRLVEKGLGQFYNEWSDYLPGYLYVLWGLGWVKESVNIPEILLYKLPAILADVATGFLIFRVVSRFSAKHNKSLALFSACLYLFNPAVFANSTLWGQVDSLTSLTVVASVFFARDKPVFSALALGVGALIKPQAVFIVPIVGLLWLKEYGIGRSIVYTLTSFASFLLGFVPFAGSHQLLPFVFERLNVTANQYPYTSINAFNFWAIFSGMWKDDGGGLQILGIVITVIAASFLIYRLFHSNEKVNYESKIYLLSSCLLLISFLFLTRMHERHLLPVFAPLAVATAYYPALWISYGLLSTTYLVNLFYSFIWINEGFKMIFSQEAIWLFSALNLMAGAFIVMVFLKARQASATSFSKTLVEFGRWFGFNPRSSLGVSSRIMLKTKNVTHSVRNSTHFSKELPPLFRHTRLILSVVLLFSLLPRIVGLWHPSTFYFDEVYHAFTAREMLRGNPAAWEWWNTPPEGFAYEWTHPPLAKLFMVGSMMIFGENPFAWRLPGALLGTATVFLVYLLGVQLFKSRTIGLLSAGVFALEGLPLVMSRIGMNDSYFLFFAFGAILLFLNEKYLFSSVLLGLAAASKWTSVWVIPLLFLAMLLFRQKPRFRIVWFLIIPPFIYLVSYTPFFTSGHTWNQFIELQQQMWWYHTGLAATHAYQSFAFSWPLNLRPVWLFVENKDNFVSNIYILGNPVVFWVGLVALGSAGLTGVMKKQPVLLFIFFSWALLFLPWAFSPRVMFLYHYLSAIPFLSLALGWFLSQQKKGVIILAYCLFAIAYLLFYPHWTGIFIPEWLDNFYYIIPSWK